MGLLDQAIREKRSRLQLMLVRQRAHLFVGRSATKELRTRSAMAAMTSEQGGKQVS